MPDPVPDAVPDPAGGPLLEVSGLQMRFGGLLALDGVSFTAAAGAVTAVIGPNGAGKTTLFNCVTGMYRPTGGRVRFAGTDTTGARPNRVARLGIARTFQNLALFAGLSVLDNLLVGAYREGSSGLLGGAVRSPRSRAEQRRAVAEATEVLHFLHLADAAHLRPHELPYGRQKQVEFARALMQKARLVMLDEPMAGMSAPERGAMLEVIGRVRARYAMTFLIVEHDVPVVMAVSDKVVVLDFGRKIAEGTPAAVQSDPAVVAAYLGTRRHGPPGRQASPQEAVA